MPPFALLMLGLTAAMVLIMALAWAFQKATRNTGWVDVFWTFGTGLIGAAAALWPLPGDDALPARRWLAAILVGLWALRLGGYIALRVARSPDEDSRYVALRKKWGGVYDRRLFSFVLVQGPISGILALAVGLAARAPGEALGLRDAAAILIWMLAVIGEAAADAQMQRFRADKANHGKIMDRGLWGLSRHPNYFFEWIVWWAWPALALDPSQPVSWLTLGAPLVMFLVLRFATGVPPLERSMLERRGDAFRAYQARVNAFIPGPPKRGAAVQETSRP